MKKQSAQSFSRRLRLQQHAILNSQFKLDQPWIQYALLFREIWMALFSKRFGKAMHEQTPRLRS
jgi:hypothetical protein